MPVPVTPEQKLAAKKRSIQWAKDNRPKVNAFTKKKRDSNPDVVREYSRNWRQRKKDAIIDHYGGDCNLCHIVDREVLTLDHVMNNGAEHRRQVPISQMYSWVVKNNFPLDFRVLCFNCNHKAFLFFRRNGEPLMKLGE